MLEKVSEGVLTAAAAAVRGRGRGGRESRDARRRSNRALPREFRERELEVAGDLLHWGFGPTLLAEQLERGFALRVSPGTLRRWMMEAGFWKRQRSAADVCGGGRSQARTEERPNTPPGGDISIPA